MDPEKKLELPVDINVAKTDNANGDFRCTAYKSVY